MAGYVGNSNNSIIENLPEEYISKDGVLDLTKTYLFGYSSFNTTYKVPMGIKTNAINGILKEIIFPENFKIYQSEEYSSCQSLSYTGVRKFNIPKSQSITYFATLVIEKDITNFVDYITSAKGPLKYSELIMTLNISEKRLKDLLQYYKGISWIQDIYSEIEKAIIIEEKTYQQFDIKKNELVLKVLKALLTLITKGYLFNICWYLDKNINIEEENNKKVNHLCGYELDNNGKIVITFETNGDTYVIRIDDVSKYSTASIPLPLEAADAFQILFDNSEILRYILNKAESKMNDDITKGKVFTGDISTITSKQERTKKCVNLLEDPGIRHAIMRKKHDEIHGDYILCEKLCVEPAFIYDNFEEIKSLNLLSYFDLSFLDTSLVDITCTNLSYSNIKVKIFDGMSLKGTNLTGVNLSGKIIAKQTDIRGANFSLTGVIITVPCSCDETTVFDETCYFIDYKGQCISHETLRADGYNIKPILKDAYLMRIGNEQLHVKEPSPEELKQMNLPNGEAESMFILDKKSQTFMSDKMGNEKKTPENQNFASLLIDIKQDQTRAQHGGDLPNIKKVVNVEDEKRKELSILQQELKLHFDKYKLHYLKSLFTSIRQNIEANITISIDFLELISNQKLKKEALDFLAQLFEQQLKEMNVTGINVSVLYDVYLEQEGHQTGDSANGSYVIDKEWNNYLCQILFNVNLRRFLKSNIKDAPLPEGDFNPNILVYSK